MARIPHTYDTPAARSWLSQFVHKAAGPFQRAHARALDASAIEIVRNEDYPVWRLITASDWKGTRLSSAAHLATQTFRAAQTRPHQGQSAAFASSLIGMGGAAMAGVRALFTEPDDITLELLSKLKMLRTLNDQFGIQLTSDARGVHVDWPGMGDAFSHVPEATPTLAWIAYKIRDIKSLATDRGFKIFLNDGELEVVTEMAPWSLPIGDQRMITVKVAELNFNGASPEEILHDLRGVETLIKGFHKQAETNIFKGLLRLTAKSHEATLFFGLSRECNAGIEWLEAIVVHGRRKYFLFMNDSYDDKEANIVETLGAGENLEFLNSIYFSGDTFRLKIDHTNGDQSIESYFLSDLWKTWVKRERH